MKQPHLRYLSVLLAALPLAVGAACHQQTGPIEPAPPPRRPTEIKVKRDRPRVEDCQPVDVRSSPASMPYRERSISEARNLADQGFTFLKQSEERALPRTDRERYLTEAVDRFITALLADPYNVHATYNLAAAYARIDRPQCAVNLLARLVELRKLQSHQAAVEEKLDRLLGRSKFRGRLDPDFYEMRDMEIFRELVKRF